ncbi:hypothetical protein ACFYUY_01710 [Kitasatospora sp. NPDC004745]|uniref:hypothetical protein n=1 Tax=Kitasatospora sp. NPDC004745 TaxID=3364019 RepID=UPI0036A89DAB
MSQPQPTVSIELDGRHVPLDQCGWLYRQACGCIRAATLAHVTGDGGWTITTPDQARRHFTPRKDSRAREIRQGATVELITMTHYREHIASNWECPDHQLASQETSR